MSGEPTVDHARLFAGLPAPYLVLDPDLRIVEASDAYLAATMRSRAEIVGRPIFDAFPVNPAGGRGDGADRVSASLERVLTTRGADTAGVLQYDIPTPDGFRVRYWSVIHTPLLDERGEVELIVQRADDVTELVGEFEAGGMPVEHASQLIERAAGLEVDLLERARELQESNRRLNEAKTRLERVVAQQAMVAALGHDALRTEEPDSLIVRAAAELVDLPEIDFCQVLEVARDGGLRLRAHAGALADSELDGELADRLAAVAAEFLGSARPVSVERLPGGAAAMAAAIGEPEHPIGVLLAGSTKPGAFSDEDRAFLASVANALAGGIQRAHREAAMARRALHDDLTGLPNRKLLLDRLSQGLARARRDAGHGALGLIDLDGFKAINDTLGHHAGDLVLQQVAERLAAVLRGSDTVARLGGDEFALLLPDVPTPVEAARVAEKVLNALAQPMELEDHQLSLTASVGLALYPQHGDDDSLLLRRADAAMYVAKRAGTGHAVYTAEHDESRQRRRSAVGALRRAIDDAELIVHYQPKFSLSDHGVCGVEALVRWRHPRRGLVAPDQFLPLAEESGLIRPLTVRVITTALEQARRWREAGFEIPVSINLSSDCLHDPSLVETLLKRIARARVTAAALELEVAESAFMQRPGAAMAVIAELAEVGIRTAMDDFGTGQSSLAYLERLAVHELKIDKSFLLAGSPPRGESVVNAVIDLAHNFGLAVVGEGIESSEVLDALRNRGCDRGQGFHLQRPLPAEELTSWLLARRTVPAQPA